MPNGQTSQSNPVVGFDIETARRVLKVTRQVESAGIQAPSSLSRQQFTIEQVIVPRSGPDGDGLYTCDIYIVNDPVAGTYTQVATNQKARLLPNSL